MTSYSEFDLIAFIRAGCRSTPTHVDRAIGDDCAVFAPSFAHRLVCTSDLLVEGTHFRSDWISPRFLGRKACLVNLSDLAAMGARPYACLLNLAFQPVWREGRVQGLIEGFIREAESRGMPLIGGDLSRSDRLFISVTALGYVEEGDPLLRSTARPGDRIFVIGELGLSRSGLELLEESQGVDLSRIEDDSELRRVAGSDEAYRCLRAHLCPTAHVEEGVWLQQNHAARAMIDISDGLASDLLHILEESHVAGVIEVDALATPTCDGEQDATLELQLDGGEDYALLFTADSGMCRKIAEEYPPDWPQPRPIGRIIDGPPQLFIDADGERKPYEPRGFDHFR